MEIYALKGHKVKCIRFDSGYHYLTERAEKHLEIGKTYTVEKTEVHQSRTGVELHEFPGIEFCSGVFEDIIPQSEEDNKKHPSYSRFNPRYY